jgi:hypothetical protein
VGVPKILVMKLNELCNDIKIFTPESTGAGIGNTSPTFTVSDRLDHILPFIPVIMIWKFRPVTYGISEGVRLNHKQSFVPQPPT